MLSVFFHLDGWLPGQIGEVRLSLEPGITIDLFNAMSVNESPLLVADHDFRITVLIVLWVTWVPIPESSSIRCGTKSIPSLIGQFDNKERLVRWAPHRHWAMCPEPLASDNVLEAIPIHVD